MRHRQLGHLKYHLRLQCPQELRVVMREVPLHRIEELFVGIARELRPALALGDPALTLIDHGHLSRPVR